MTFLQKILCALVLWASAAHASLAEELDASGEWLQFHYMDYTERAGQLPIYSLSLLPSDIMTVRYVSYAEAGSFEHQVDKGLFASLDQFIKERWPTGTVQEFQCTSGLDHDVRFKLILSKPARHVSTAWHDSCLEEDKHKDLLVFSNALRELLDTDNIENELRKRTADADHQ